MRILLGICLLVGLTACSGGGSSGSGGGSGKAGSKAEALARLSTEHRSQFESWQKQILKSCDAGEAFGISLRQQQPEGVDAAALITNNNGSAVFTGSQNLWILSGYNSLSGVSESKAESTTDSYSVTAEAKREGSYCTVYLYGQKVYETVIARNFEVGTHYSAGKVAQISAPAPLIADLGNSSISEVTKHGVFTLLNKTFAPSKEALTNFGKNLGLTSEESAKWFVGGRASVSESAVRIDGDSTFVWSNSESGSLIGQASSMKYFDGSRELPLEVRLSIPRFNFAGVQNATDAGNLKLLMAIGIARSGKEFNYSLNKLQNDGLVSFNKEEAKECVNARVEAYAMAQVKGTIKPSLYSTMSVCRALYAEIEKEAYESGLFKTLIPVVFKNIVPSAQYQYEGWQSVLLKLTQNALANNKDIGAELDPSQQTRIVPIVARSVMALKSEIDTFKNLQPARDRFYEAGVFWSLNGHSMSEGHIHHIAESLSNSWDVFSYSSDVLLSQLMDNPNGLDEQLNFAARITREYKDEALGALNLSRALNYTEFERDIFNQVIQKQISLDEIKEWKIHLSTVQSEINRYANLAPVRGELVGLSVKWLRNGEASIDQLRGTYSALNNSVQPFEESTKQLVRDLQKSLIAFQDAVSFAGNLSPEYKQLAIAIAQNSKAAECERWGTDFFNSVLQKRPSLEQVRQWSDMWISIVGFVAREKARVGDELGSMPDWNRKKLIETAVKESWSSRDFAAVEAIAPVAKFKNTCDRYKDVSSQAECAGMKLFSKAPKMFLDPSHNYRYSAFGQDFNGYMNRLSAFEWTSLRWTMIGEFFGSWDPIWSKCDDSTFNQKAALLKSQVEAIATTTDQFKKRELERQIKETVQNCR